MDRQFVSFPKSGRSWLRYALTRLRVEDEIFFHHDGFEYNDGSRPPLEFDLRRRESSPGHGKSIIYLSRDPRDVMVSLYHQITGRFSDFFNYTGSISEFIRDPYFGASNLKNFRSQWERLCADGYALAISYEDCHLDFAGTLAKVVSHYGFDIGETDIHAATKEAEFKAMRDVEESGVFLQPWLQLRNGTPKVRRGLIGGFSDELKDIDIEYLNSIFL